MNKITQIQKNIKHPKLFITALIIVALILVKVIRLAIAVGDNGTFESEKKEILQRREWLIRKVITEPQKLIYEMPAAIGPQFQGEWSLYSCSMLSSALVNILKLYPKTVEENIIEINHLLRRMTHFLIVFYPHSHLLRFQV